MAASPCKDSHDRSKKDDGRFLDDDTHLPHEADRFLDCADPFLEEDDPCLESADGYLESADRYLESADWYLESADRFPESADRFLEEVGHCLEDADHLFDDADSFIEAADDHLDDEGQCIEHDVLVLFHPVDQRSATDRCQEAKGECRETRRRGTREGVGFLKHTDALLDHEARCLDEMVLVLVDTVGATKAKGGCQEPNGDLIEKRTACVEKNAVRIENVTACLEHTELCFEN